MSTASGPKVPLAASAAYSTATTQSQITTALIASGAIPTIQSTLLHELQASGWTANLRAYITALMRSGECTRYDDLMDRVLEEALRDVVAGKSKANGAATANGSSKAVADEGLAVPDAAIREGIKVVKRELEKVCEVA